MKKIRIIHLYPKEMNIYGDNGNLLVLINRLKWRNIDAEVINVGIGQKIPTNSHILVGGGGQDAGQQLIADDLQKKSATIAKMSDSGVPMLMICGMYQMFGHHFKPHKKEHIKGIGVLGLYTVAEPGRLIGNICVKSPWGYLIGYENHSGRTYLDSIDSRLGEAKLHQGNNGKDRTEGAIKNNTYGTYLHGPILAKAPVFADLLLQQALTQCGLDTGLIQLNDIDEESAAKVAKSRPR